MSSRLSAADASPAFRCESGLSVVAAHIWRSQLVEKCAEAERHILWLLDAAGATCQTKAPLSQKIEALKKATAAAPPNVCSTKLLVLLDRLRPLSDLRSELVHSTVSIASIEGEPVAVFRNSAQQIEGVGDRTIMTKTRLNVLYGALSDVANGLKQRRAGLEQDGLPLSRE